MLSARLLLSIVSLHLVQRPRLWIFMWKFSSLRLLSIAGHSSHLSGDACEKNCVINGVDDPFFDFLSRCFGVSLFAGVSNMVDSLPGVDETIAVVGVFVVDVVSGAIAWLRFGVDFAWVKPCFDGFGVDSGSACFSGTPLFSRIFFALLGAISVTVSAAVRFNFRCESKSDDRSITDKRRFADFTGFGDFGRSTTIVWRRILIRDGTIAASPLLPFKFVWSFSISHTSFRSLLRLTRRQRTELRRSRILCDTGCSATGGGIAWASGSGMVPALSGLGAPSVIVSSKSSSSSSSCFSTVAIALLLSASRCVRFIGENELRIVIMKGK